MPRRKFVYGSTDIRQKKRSCLNALAKANPGSSKVCDSVGPGSWSFDSSSQPCSTGDRVNACIDLGWTWCSSGDSRVQRTKDPMAMLTPWQLTLQHWRLGQCQHCPMLDLVQQELQLESTEGSPPEDLGCSPVEPPNARTNPDVRVQQQGQPEGGRGVEPRHRMGVEDAPLATHPVAKVQVQHSLSLKSPQQQPKVLTTKNLLRISTKDESPANKTRGKTRPGLLKVKGRSLAAQKSGLMTWLKSSKDKAKSHESTTNDRAKDKTECRMKNDIGCSPPGPGSALSKSLTLDVPSTQPCSKSLKADDILDLATSLPNPDIHESGSNQQNETLSGRNRGGGPESPIEE